MLWSLLIASCVTGSLAAFCRLDANSTACTAPSVTNCVGVCDLYLSEKPCKSVTGCNWGNNRCSPQNTSNNCPSYTNETLCAANTMCSWLTTPCKLRMSCDGDDATCVTTPNMTATACTSQNPACMLNPICEGTTPCGMFDTQSACVANPGCFYYTGSTSMLGVVATGAECRGCFNDPSKLENVFLNFQSHIGQTCTLPIGGGATATLQFYTAMSASSGCTGGEPIADPPGQTCSPAAALSMGIFSVLAVFLA